LSLAALRVAPLGALAAALASLAALPPFGIAASSRYRFRSVLGPQVEKGSALWQERNGLSSV